MHRNRSWFHNDTRDPLNRHSEQFIKENGGLYAWSEVSFTIGREALIFALGGGAIRAVGAGGLWALKGIGVGEKVLCTIQTTTKAGLFTLGGGMTVMEASRLGTTLSGAMDAYNRQDYVGMAKGLTNFSFSALNVASGSRVLQESRILPARLVRAPPGIRTSRVASRQARRFARPPAVG